MVILISVAILILIIIVIVIRSSRLGPAPIFLTSYNILKKELPEDYPDKESFILLESFKPFLKRKPFNILNENDINGVIDVLEPWPDLRPGLMSAILFLADRLKNAAFIKNKDTILPILKQYYKNGKGESTKIYNRLNSL